MLLGSFCYCFRPRPRQCVVNIDDDDDATGRFEYFHFSFFHAISAEEKQRRKNIHRNLRYPTAAQHTGSFVKQSRKPNLNGFIAGNPAEPESTREKKKSYITSSCRFCGSVKLPKSCRPVGVVQIFFLFFIATNLSFFRPSPL